MMPAKDLCGRSGGSQVNKKQSYSFVRYDPNTYEANQIVYEVGPKSQACQQVPSNVKIEQDLDVKPPVESLLNTHLNTSVGDDDYFSDVDGADYSNNYEFFMDREDSADDQNEQENSQDDQNEQEDSQDELPPRALFSGRSRTPGWHICTECSYTTKFKRNLTRHMAIHSEKPLQKCDSCERTFTTKTKLISHAKCHLQGQLYQCNCCDAQFSNKYNFESHLRHEHPSFKPYKCEECDYFSVEKSKLKRHMRCHTGDKPFQCPHCTHAASDSFNLKRHILTHTGERPYACDVCELRFTQSGDLTLHKLKQHSKVRPYNCTKCPSSFVKPGELRRHIQSMHTPYKPFLCKKCNITLPDKYQYKLHNQAHKEKKVHQCRLCIFSGVSQENLELHMLEKHKNPSDAANPSKGTNKFQPSQVSGEPKEDLEEKNVSLDKERKIENSLEHTAQKQDAVLGKRLNCNKCPTLFKRNAELRRHMRVFHAPKEFECEHCTLKLPDKYEYQLHIKNHQVRRYQCEKCNYSAKTATHLRNHSLTHQRTTPSFKCDICDKLYSGKRGLDRHKVDHHDPSRVADESIFKCHLCPKEYARNCHLVRHLEGHKIRAEKESVSKKCRIKSEPLFQMVSEESGVRIKDEPKDASKCFGFNDDDESEI